MSVWGVVCVYVLYVYACCMCVYVVCGVSVCVVCVYVGGMHDVCICGGRGMCSMCGVCSMR